MGILAEFRNFAMRGNVVDMAVGIVIGASFGKIVSSLVDNVIMPPIGLIIGGVDFSDLKVTLKEAVGDAPAVTLNYGQFIQTIVDFTIIAFAIFMVVKALNRVKERFDKPADALPAEAPPPPADVQLLTEIRDLLKNRPL
jgi:large conductance mechanosensitive channel